jgi:hypothetical protein
MLISLPVSTFTLFLFYVRVKVEPVENSVHDLKKEQPNNISIGKKRKGKKEKAEIKYETENSVDVKKEKWEPPIWRKQLKNMYEMRKNRDAPVDSMGCDVISDVTAKPEVCLQLCPFYFDVL